MVVSRSTLETIFDLTSYEGEPRTGTPRPDLKMDCPRLYIYSDTSRFITVVHPSYRAVWVPSQIDPLSVVALSHGRNLEYDVVLPRVKVVTSPSSGSYEEHETPKEPAQLCFALPACQCPEWTKLSYETGGLSWVSRISATLDPARSVISDLRITAHIHNQTELPFEKATLRLVDRDLHLPVAEHHEYRQMASAQSLRSAPASAPSVDRTTREDAAVFQLAPRCLSKDEYALLASGRDIAYTKLYDIYLQEAIRRQARTTYLWTTPIDLPSGAIRLYDLDGSIVGGAQIETRRSSQEVEIQLGESPVLEYDIALQNVRTPPPENEEGQPTGPGTLRSVIDVTVYPLVTPLRARLRANIGRATVLEASPGYALRGGFIEWNVEIRAQSTLRLEYVVTD